MGLSAYTGWTTLPDLSNYPGDRILPVGSGQDTTISQEKYNVVEISYTSKLDFIYPIITLISNKQFVKPSGSCIRNIFEIASLHGSISNQFQISNFSFTLTTPQLYSDVTGQVMPQVIQEKKTFFHLLSKHLKNTPL
jgi:hypothetical protein